jgi:predicted nucleotidyltransferase
MFVVMEQRIIEVLKIVSQKLRGQKIRWVLVGSTSLALQGVRLKPEDIDILTDKEGAFEINKLLKEYETEPVRFKESDRFQSYLGRFKIKEVNVEVMGNLKIKIGNEWIPSERLVSRRTINIEGMGLPVFPLKKELELYEKLGRRKDHIRIQKVKEALKRRRR